MGTTGSEAFRADCSRRGDKGLLEVVSEVAKLHPLILVFQTITQLLMTHARFIIELLDWVSGVAWL